MKRAIILSLIIIFTIPAFSKINIDLGIGYNFGVSNFFNKTQKDVLENEKTYVETRENSMGLNFNAGISYKFLKRIIIRGSVSINYGNQIYSYENPEDSYDDGNDRDEFLFNIKKINLDLGIKPLLFKNGWELFVFIGSSYNIFKSDIDMKLEDENYLTIRTGIIADFIQLKHFGFRFISLFEYPINSNLNIQNISLSANLLYKF